MLKRVAPVALMSVLLVGCGGPPSPEELLKDPQKLMSAVLECGLMSRSERNNSELCANLKKAQQQNIYR